MFAIPGRVPLTIGERGAGRVLAVGSTLAWASGATLLVAHVVNHAVLDDRINQLQASAEHNVWSWAASMAAVAAGIAVLLYSRFTPHPVRAFTLGVLLVFFAFDDWVEVHEKLGDGVSGVLGLPDYVGPRLWVVLYLPLTAAIAMLLWLLAGELGGPARRQILVGVVLLASAYALEAVGIVTKRLEERGFGLPHAVRAGIEEAVELTGMTLVAAGLAAGMLAAAARRAPGAPGTESRRESSLAR